MVLRLVVAIAVTLALCWILFLVLLAVLRPRGFDLRETTRFVPDLVRLVRDLARDPDVPTGVKRRLGVLAVYLAFPIDVVPDFVPVLGYADDVIVIALVLRAVVRHAGADALDEHWHGTPQGLQLTRRLAGLDTRSP